MIKLRCFNEIEKAKEKMRFELATAPESYFILYGITRSGTILPYSQRARERKAFKINPCNATK